VWDRLTFDPGDEIFPLWSHDDQSMIFGAVRSGSNVVRPYRRLIAAAPETEEPVLQQPGPDFQFPMDLSPDDRHLLFTMVTPGRNMDIWVTTLAPNAQAAEVVATAANEELPQFSPDGKWIAYQSDKTGSDEIYVRPFPGPGADTRVSAAGGIQARWNPQGKELFYIAADDRMMAVPVTLGPGLSTIDIGKPEPLFPTEIGSTVRLKYRHQYAVTPDGQSFLLNSAIMDSTTAPIILVLNWKPPSR
jgi:Tol biopolymer transport system component